MKHRWIIAVALCLMIITMAGGCQPGTPAQVTPLPEATETAELEQATPLPEATETAIPEQETMPTEEPSQWIEMPDIGLSFALPTTWGRQEEGVWVEEGHEASSSVGVRWAELEPPMEAEAVLLPEQSLVLESEAVTLAWGDGRTFIVETYATLPEEGTDQAAVQSVEKHTIVVACSNGSRLAIDLYATAEDVETLSSIEPILEDVVNSSTLEASCGDE